MSTTPLIDKYWFEVSDLTIFEAAFWMQIGSDPRLHNNRYEQDSTYADYFDEHPGGAESVYEKCDVIVSAIRVGHIAASAEIRLSDQTLDAGRSRIQKTAWIEWCKENGYWELANRFTRKRGKQVGGTEDESAAGTSPPDWRESAREIADALFDHDTEMKTRDTLANYAKRVMGEMQAQEIHAPRGRIDNPKTIQRDALQGDLWWAKKKK